MKLNVIRDKSFQFAVEVVNTTKTIQARDREFILSRQFLRSGTSIGASVRESINAESTLDFIHKLGVAQKECDETLYWLDLMHATDYLTNNEFMPLQKNANELMRILCAIIVTTRKNLNKSKPPKK